VLGLLAQAFGVLCYVFASQLGEFYSVAAVVGFIYAGVMPLYAVIVRENFPLRMMGTIIGGTAMAGSLGMSLGPLVGGLLYDHFDSYAYLYIASWGMGLAAFLIAMTFRPYPRREAMVAPLRALSSRSIHALLGPTPLIRLGAFAPTHLLPQGAKGEPGIAALANPRLLKVSKEREVILFLAPCGRG